MKSANKRPAKRERYMSGKAFADLKQALEDALAYQRGNNRSLNATRIQKPRLSKAGSLKRTLAEPRS